MTEYAHRVDQMQGMFLKSHAGPSNAGFHKTSRYLTHTSTHIKFHLKPAAL